MPARTAARARVLPVASASRNAPRRGLTAPPLHIEAAGSGPPVVLVHAGICDSRMWEPQWRTFPRAYRTVRYDIRGFGRSPLDGGPVSHGRDLVEVVETAAKAPAVLVGASLGGRVALEVAVARPDLVRALVLVGAALPDHEWSEEVRAFGAAEDAALERGDLDEAVELNVRLWADGPRRSAADVDPGVRELVRAMQRRAFELQLPFLDVEEGPLVPDLSERLTGVEAPALVVVGEMDVPDMHAVAGRLVAALPNAERATIAATAHLPSLERPTEFDALVLPFLESVQPGSTSES